MAGTSQNLGGGGGGGGGGSFIGILSVRAGDRLLCSETSEILAGELWVLPEPLTDDDEDVDKETDGIIGRAGTGMDAGAGKEITESGDFDFKLVGLGLKFKVGDAESDTEFAGEAEFEHGYDAVLELKLLLPKFAALNNLRELDPVRTGLSFRPEDPLGEKNSSSSSPSSSFPSFSEETMSGFPLLCLKLSFGRGGSGLSSGEPSF